MISEEMIMVVPLHQAPWFRERNLDFESLKHVQGNYVWWKRLRLITAKSKWNGPIQYDRDILIDQVCGTLVQIRNLGLQPRSEEGLQMLNNYVYSLHEINFFIDQVFKVVVDPLFYYV